MNRMSLTSAVPSRLNLASWILRPLCRSLTKQVLTAGQQTNKQTETLKYIQNHELKAKLLTGLELKGLRDAHPE